MKNIHLISLGCPKTRVDSEVMYGLAAQNGWKLVSEPEEADVIIVNTCAFLEASVNETIDTLLNAADYKKSRCKKLIATGCLTSRYGEDELQRLLPEVDAFLNTYNFSELPKILAGVDTVVRGPCLDDRAFLSRRLPQKQSFAYLKISEGCDRRCAFCAIPLIRGRQVSRSPDSLVREAAQLREAGVREIVLVAQESTNYGTDLGLRNALPTLIEEIEKIDGIEWIRLMYAYPWNFKEDLIQRLGTGKLLPYVDIPLQHVSEKLLRAMRRGVSKEKQVSLLRDLRKIPGLVLRTSLIVGFPGESEDDFEQLCDWVREVRFDRMGVFCFSPEDGTEAATMPDQIPEEVKQDRYDRLMQIQQEIHAEKMENLIGQELDVIVDGPSEEHPLVVEGRYYGQAPEVDGKVFLSFEDGCDPDEIECGSMLKVRIDDCDAYDLVGVVL